MKFLIDAGVGKKVEDFLRDEKYNIKSVEK